MPFLEAGRHLWLGPLHRHHDALCFDKARNKFAWLPAMPCLLQAQELTRTAEPCRALVPAPKDGLSS